MGLLFFIMMLPWLCLCVINYGGASSMSKESIGPYMVYKPESVENAAKLITEGEKGSEAPGENTKTSIIEDKKENMGGNRKNKDSAANMKDTKRNEDDIAQLDLLLKVKRLLEIYGFKDESNKSSSQEIELKDVREESDFKGHNDEIQKNTVSNSKRKLNDQWGSQEFKVMDKKENHTEEKGISEENKLINVTLEPNDVDGNGRSQENEESDETYEKKNEGSSQILTSGYLRDDSYDEEDINKLQENKIADSEKEAN